MMIPMPMPYGGWGNSTASRPRARRYRRRNYRFNTQRQRKAYLACYRQGNSKKFCYDKSKRVIKRNWKWVKQADGSYRKAPKVNAALVRRGEKDVFVLRRNIRATDGVLETGGSWVNLTSLANQQAGNPVQGPQPQPVVGT